MVLCGQANGVDVFSSTMRMQFMPPEQFEQLLKQDVKVDGKVLNMIKQGLTSSDSATKQQSQKYKDLLRQYGQWID